jgi:hypothetical protein
MSTKNRIINPAPPNLPLGTDQYERRYQDQFTNILRLYFNQLQNALTEITGNAGGRYLAFPYGAFSDFTDQTTTINTATLITLDTTDFSNGVSVAANSEITVEYAGIYNLQFSVQLQNLDNAPQDVFIWLKQNDADITGSTGLVGMPARKSAGVPFHDIKGWNYFLSMNAGDHVQIYWSTTNVDVTIQTYPASGTPTKPSTASVVATLSFVSALPT